MAIGKTVSIKILNYNSNTDDFIKTINEINKKNSLMLKENILDYAWGYQDTINNLRINLFQNKHKVEFVVIYDDIKEIKKYLDMIKTFLDLTSIDFKSIALAFGQVYFDYPTVNYKFIKPEFTKEDKLKYKLSTDIKYVEEDEGIYLSTNFHFYGFGNYNTNPIKIVEKEILNKFDKYHGIFTQMVGV